MSPLIISLLVFALFILIGREIVCWYFKVNQIVELLKEINESLKKDRIK